jgi:hypothetical protein
MTAPLQTFHFSLFIPEFSCGPVLFRGGPAEARTQLGPVYHIRTERLGWLGMIACEEGSKTT